MSWIKQMFAKIMNDRDENIEVNKNTNEPNQGKLNMRMTYQYPKNNFRFPLIDHVPKNDEYVIKKNVVDKKQRKRPDVKRVYEKKEEPNRKKIEPINTQPFKPTEIPSAIYGYQPPPKKKEKTLEYELQDYFLQDKIGDDIQGSLIPDDVRIEVIQPEAPEQLRPIMMADKEFGMNDNHELLDNLDDKEVDEIIHKETVIEQEQHISLLENDQPTNHSGLSNHQEIGIAEEEILVHQEPKVAEEVLVYQEPEIAEEEEVSIHQEIEMMEEVSERQEIEMMEEEVPDRQEIEMVEEEVPVHQEAEFAEEEVSITVEEVEVVETSMTQEKEKKPKKRPQMPFNVLMLKEDREKWQQKKREKYQEERIQANSDKMKEPFIKQIPDDGVSYKMPPLQLLQPPVIMDENREWLNEQSNLLNETLNNFNVKARVVHVSQGPSVTRFEVQPDPGVKVSRITNLSDDIKLSMAAKDIRIEAPIPGKRSVGIELPNQKSRPVQISEILGYPTFQSSDSPLTAALGLDISGDPVITDLRRMPHGLIAGATGSGKSVCINSILVSLLYKATPDELKLLLIDPKMVELAPYNHIPHLVSPVITDVKAATAALKWTVDEMERRYELFAHGNVRDIHRFNKIAKEKGKLSDVLPYIVVVIDELADLMMMAPADVEESICRIAQKARACGIHLLIATQRPSVDVITGLIKANVPTRIAFSVSSQVDSRTIIDISGAEKLLGRGDMLFLDSGSSKPVRLQGTFVSDEEIDQVIDHVRSQGEPNYLFEQEELLKKAQIQEDEDELFMESCEFIVSQGSASTSLLQRHFRIGYNRAARLIFMMEERGLISEARGSKARDVLIGEKELSELKETTLL